MASITTAADAGKLSVRHATEDQLLTYNTSGENRLPGQRCCPLRPTFPPDGLIVLQVPQGPEGKQDRKRYLKGHSRGGYIAI